MANRTRKSKNKNPRASLQEQFPSIVTDHWDWDGNKVLGLDPSVLLSTSAIQAYFTCPEGHHFRAPIFRARTVAKSPGKNFCPLCENIFTTEEADSE